MIAFTRAVSPSLGRCELSHLERRPIDVHRATMEHEAYEAALEAAGCDVRRLPPLPDHADAVFVEDAAVVFEEVAVLARPGAESRRGEVDSVADGLAALRPLVRIQAPATLDGGDVLRAGRTVWVGESARTNTAAHRQLRAVLEPLGYEVRSVPVTGCLHLKTAVTAVSDDAVLLHSPWVDGAGEAFEDRERIEVDPAEPDAANVLRVGSSLLVRADATRTRRRLETLGFPVVPVALGELAKAEAGLTCCSLLVDSPVAGAAPS